MKGIVDLFSTIIVIVILLYILWSLYFVLILFSISPIFGIGFIVFCAFLGIAAMGMGPSSSSPLEDKSPTSQSIFENNDGSIIDEDISGRSCDR